MTTGGKNLSDLAIINSSSKPQQQKDIFTVTIKAIKSSGAVVEMPNGETGWLPAYEIDANFREYQDFKAQGKDYLGKTIPVIKLSDRYGQKNIVSCIRVDNDPWEEVYSWKDNEVLIMEVTGINESQVIGLIKPGIRAMIWLDTLKRILPISWGEFAKPLIGDEVAGYFHPNSVDHENRILILDIVSYARSLGSVSKALMSSIIELETQNSSSQINAQIENSLIRSRFQDALFKNIQYVLIVDDDDVFRNSLKNFINQKGCTVIDCRSESEASLKIKERKADFHLGAVFPTV